MIDFIPYRLVQFLVPRKYCFEKVITVNGSVMDVRPARIDDIAGTVIEGAPVNAVVQCDVICTLPVCQLFSLFELGHLGFLPDV